MDQNLYKYLVENPTEVLQKIALTSRREVAEQLGISYMRLTHILPLLKELAKRKLNESK